MSKWIAILLFFMSCSLYAFEDAKKFPEAGTIALTFDDGPNPTYTPQILAILKKYHIKATFFVVGMNAEKYPELIKQIYADGHAINSHSQTHPMLTKISEKQLQNEIEKPKEIIHEIIGINPKCLRYPFGMSNHHVRDQIHAHGMTPVPMGFNSFDYDRPGSEKISSWVLKNIYSKQNLNENSHTVSQFLNKNQALIVKITLSNGQTVEKKVIF